MSLWRAIIYAYRAYEEAKPMIAKFRFHPEKRELLISIIYTRVVSVDSITLINPNPRIRRILNYRRPSEGKPLQEVRLVGFGVEQRTVFENSQKLEK